MVLSDFFRQRATFFRIFFVAKGSPFKFVDVLQQTEVSKSPKGLPSQAFQHYETASKFSFSVFFYVSKGSKGCSMSPKAGLSFFFDILQKTGFSRTGKGPPFYNFQNFALFEPEI